VRVPHSVASYTGSLVFTSERVLATLSMLPRLAGPTVDVRWDAPQTGPAKVEITSTGLQVDVDLDAERAPLYPKFSGELSLHYKVAIPDDVLDGLPLRSLAFDMPPEYVFRAVGVTYSP
jgi:hypothetical protein